MRRILSILAAVLCFSAAVFAQAPEQTVTWAGSVSALQDSLLEVRFTGAILEGWHTYSLRDEYSATEITFEAPDGYTLEGGLQEIGTPRQTASGELVFERRIVLSQQVRPLSGDAVLKGTISWNSCNDTMCAAPESWSFQLPLVPTQTAALQEEPAAGETSRWSLVLEAIAAKEGVEITEEDIEAEYKRMAESFGMTEDDVKGFMTDADKESMKKDLEIQKALELITA